MNSWKKETKIAFITWRVYHTSAQPSRLAGPLLRRRRVAAVASAPAGWLGGWQGTSTQRTNWVKTSERSTSAHKRIQEPHTASALTHRRQPLGGNR